MSPASSGEVRRFLAALASGTAPSVDPSLWESLVGHGAVSGSQGAPSITPVGRHVLSELEVRAYRTDALPLETVAGQLTRVLGDLDGVAHTAEYFLAELGPVTPPEALPLLRPISIELANRRETPEELAEEFRNIWGATEVMGGNPRDRLLAAALLQAGGANMEKVYAPMMTTSIAVRDAAGPRSPAVTIAALLHLNPRADGSVALDAYLALRKIARTEEGAAILAATGQDPASLTARRAALLSQLAQGGTPTGDDQVAAGYLAVCGADPARHLPRLSTLRGLLQRRFPSPEVAGALLAVADWLEPAELVNWLDKAQEIAQRRRLAPTPRELSALGLALVLGLPPSEFIAEGAATVRPLVRLANLVAVTAWVYGELIPTTSPGTPPTLH